MILRYYGGNTSIEKLTELLNTNKYGTTASNIVKLSSQLGFDSYGIKIGIEKLKDVTFPCIAHVKYDNGLYHYVVLYKFNKKNETLIVADPAKKISKVKINEFLKIWTGIILNFVPIKNIPILKEKDNYFKYIIDIFKPYKKYIVQIQFFSFLVIFMQIINSLFFKLMLDFSNQGISYIYIIGIIFIVLNINKVLCNYFKGRLIINVNKKIDFCLTNDIYNKIINLPFKYFYNRNVGEIVDRMYNVEGVKEILINILILIFTDIPLYIISTILLYIFNRRIFIFVFILSILYLVFNILFANIIAKSIVVLKDKKENFYSYINQSISGYSTIKSSNLESYVTNNFRYKNYEYAKEKENLNKKFVFGNLINEFLDMILNIVPIMIGCIHLYNGKINIAALITYTYIIGYIFEPIKNIGNIILRFKEIKIAFIRILEIMGKKNIDSNLVLDKINKIQLKNLSFSYFDNKPVLENINISINMNDKIMIIGKNGSGKSSIMKLLMGFYTPTKGEILYNDLNITNYSERIFKIGYCILRKKKCCLMIRY